MASLETRHFGTKEYTDESVIRMPEGMPGYLQERSFVLLSLPEHFPLVYIQSVQTSGLCFVALPVLAVDSGYRLELADDYAEILELDSRPRIGKDVLCLSLLAVDEAGAKANLMAPVVVNLKTSIAAQCINNAHDYSHQHRLLPEERAAAL